MLRQAYAHSLFALTAYDKDVLAGVVQLLGDGASILYVQDLLVRPADQRRGIASELLCRALAQYPQVYQTVLLTDGTEKTRVFFAMGLTDAAETGCRAFVRFQYSANPGRLILPARDRFHFW